MARWSVSATNWTPVAVADTADIADAGFHSIKGGTATQRINIWEVKMAGLAAASAPMQTVLARHSTVTQTHSGGHIAALDPATADLATMPTQGTTSTGTQPQRSATLYLLDLGFNAFGGLIRLQLPPEGPIGMLGSTASFGELGISSLSTGTPGLTNDHIIMETL